MNWWRNTVFCIRAILQKRRLDQDMAEEMRTHLEMQTEENLKAGMNSEAARRAARLRFGGVESIQETCREQRGTLWLEQFLQDLRYGLRTLRKQPGFTAVAVVTLALGIGVNTAMFSILAALLLRPLPFPDADRLVEINSSHRKDAALADYGVSVPDFRDWRAEAHGFARLGIHCYSEFWLTDKEQSQPVRGRYVSSDIIPAMGVRPWLGRALVAEDEKTGGVAVLGFNLWRRLFGSETNLTSQTIVVNDQRVAVVGVMPKGFDFPYRNELWMPLQENGKEAHDRGSRLGVAIGRLKPGVRLAEVRAEMDSLARRLEERYPQENQDWGIRVATLHSKLIERVRPALPIMAGVAVFILLITCANLGNLLLSRALARKKELAIRAAIGARGWRLVRQLMTESLLLSFLGATAGFLAVLWSRVVLTALVGPHLPRFAEIKIDAMVWGYSLAVAVLTGLICSLVPAWRIWRADGYETLKEGGQQSAADYSGSWLRSILVVVQVSLAIVLLIGAGLALRSVYYLLHPGLSVDARKVLVFDVSLPKARYPDKVQRLEVFEQLLARLRALPNVEAAAASTFISYSDSMSHGIVLEDKPDPPDAPIRWTCNCAVSPDFFKTIGVPILQGRNLTMEDRQGAPKVAVINETMARRYWPGENPVGKRFAGGQGKPDEPWTTVVGVARDLRAGGVERSRRAEYYPSWRQFPYINTVVMRVTGDSARAISQFQSLLRDLDKTLPSPEVQSLDEVLDDTAAEVRILGNLLAGFAVLALTLAMVGIYGVIGYLVTQRTHEFGVRMALGAQRTDLVKLVLRWGGRLAAAGVALGLALAWCLTRLMTSLIEGVSPTDAITFGVAPALLLILSLIGCYIPALKASRTDPMRALRCE